MNKEMIEKLDGLRKDMLAKFYKELDLAEGNPADTYHSARACYYLGLAEAYANGIRVLEGKEPIPSIS